MTRFATLAALGFGLSLAGPALAQEEVGEDPNSATVMTCDTFLDLSVADQQDVVDELNVMTIGEVGAEEVTDTQAEMETVMDDVNGLIAACDEQGPELLVDVIAGM